MSAVLKQEQLEGFPTDIGNILLRMGAISYSELFSAVEMQKEQPSKRLGEILLEFEFISAVTLREALKLQSDLRADDVPVGSLVKLFNHAVNTFKETNVRMGVRLDAVLAGKR